MRTVLFAFMLLMLSACTNALGTDDDDDPGVAPPWAILPYAPAPPAVEPAGGLSSLKGAGYTPTLATVCTQTVGPNGTAKIDPCFREFGRALGMTAMAVGACSAAASKGGTAAAIIGMWGACMYSADKIPEAWGRWVDYTNADGYADWTGNEIRERLMEAAYAKAHRAPRAPGEVEP